MKRLLLPLVFLSLFAQAQHYKSLFQHSNPEWITLYVLIDLSPDDTIRIQKDTLINGLTWKKFGPFSPLFHPAVMREDTVSGKVWYKLLNGDTTTKLAFDFSLQKGAVFDLSGVWGQFTNAQQTVDTVYTENDRKVIQFAASIPGLPEKIRFIEGVGSNIGLLYKQATNAGFGHYLLCAYQGGVKVYTNKTWGLCKLPTSIHEPTEEGVRIFPNPFYNGFFIQRTTVDRQWRMELYNLSGALVHRSAQPGYIGLEKLPPGIYLLQTFSGDRRRGSYLLTKLP